MFAPGETGRPAPKEQPPRELSGKRTGAERNTPQSGLEWPTGGASLCQVKLSGKHTAGAAARLRPMAEILPCLILRSLVPG